MAVGQLHVHELRADAPALRLRRTRTGGAEGGIEGPARGSGGGVQAVGGAGGEDDLARLDERERRAFPGNVQRKYAGNALFVAHEIHGGMVVHDGYADLFGLPGEGFLLIGPVVLEPDAGAVRVGVSHEHVILRERLHVDAPLVPLVHDGDAPLKKAQGKQRVVAQPDKAVEQFAQDGPDVAAVLLRVITGEMIVAGRARAAAFGIGLFEDRDPGAAFRRRNGRTQPADASAHDRDVRFERLGYGNHKHLLAVQGVCVHMEQHVVQGKAERNGLGRAVEHAGVAVPALFAVGNFRGCLRLLLAEDLQGANAGAQPATCTFFRINAWRHVQDSLVERNGNSLCLALSRFRAIALFLK